MASNGSNPAPSKTELKIDKVIEGCQKELPAASKLTLNGQVLTVAQVIATLQGALPLFSAVRDAQTALRKAVEARKAGVPAVLLLLQALKSVLEGQFGKGNPVLSQFGFAVGHKHVPTTARKAVAAAQGKLTRQKRGTLGKRERQAIVAQTPSVSIDPAGKVSTTSPAEGGPAASEASPAPTGDGGPAGSVTGSGK